jgi:hypothetical protein
MPAARAEHAMKSPPTVRGIFIGYNFTAHDGRYHFTQHAGAMAVYRPTNLETVHWLHCLATALRCACERSRHTRRQTPWLYKQRQHCPRQRELVPRARTCRS